MVSKYSIKLDNVIFGRKSKNPEKSFCKFRIYFPGEDSDLQDQVSTFIPAPVFFVVFNIIKLWVLSDFRKEFLYYSN